MTTTLASTTKVIVGSLGDGVTGKTFIPVNAALMAGRGDFVWTFCLKCLTSHLCSAYTLPTKELSACAQEMNQVLRGAVIMNGFANGIKDIEVQFLRNFKQ